MSYLRHRGQKALHIENLETRFCLSAVSFVPHQIEDVRFIDDTVRATVAADIDDDNDLDIVAGFERTIVWYQNRDGEGDFAPGFREGTEINGTARDVISVSAADIDGDGDMDVVSLSRNRNQLFWYDNTDALGSFDPGQPISPRPLGSEGTGTAMVAGDIDGDGDIDVLASYVFVTTSSGLNRNGIVWYENIDGNGTFGSEKIIETNSAFIPRTLTLDDLDKDGDLDVVVGISDQTSDSIGWYEKSDGRGLFGLRKTISTNLNRPEGIHAADINGDRKPDLVSVSRNDGKIAWYMNTGMGFGEQQVVFEAVPAYSVFPADIDGDGDIDLVSESEAGTFWHGNVDGQGTFGPPTRVIHHLARSRATIGTGLHAADLDGDGDSDVFLANELFTEAKFWYEVRIPGDSTDDGRFDSSDLVAVFQAGEYEDSTPQNSVFEEGDWNGDGDFDSGDLVFAFQSGSYTVATNRLPSALPAGWTSHALLLLGEASRQESSDGGPPGQSPLHNRLHDEAGKRPPVPVREAGGTGSTP